MAPLFTAAAAFLALPTPPSPTQTKMVIGDPSYFPEKVEQSGSVVRAICILDHPIRDTANAVSCQLIVPGKQAGRKNGEGSAFATL